jgi:formylmethanofuran dehydrogenase subunit E
VGAGRAEDEELVAVVENDACGVDALQCLSGCTFGKGNLVFRDYGKQAYVLWNRSTGRAVRVRFTGERAPDDLRAERSRFEQWILTAPTDDVVRVTPIAEPPPECARIHASERCERCGEAVMATRVEKVDGVTLCIPCSRAVADSAGHHPA